MLKLSIIRREGSIQAFGRNVALKLLLEKAARTEPSALASPKRLPDSPIAHMKEPTGRDAIALTVETYVHPGADPVWMDTLRPSATAQPPSIL